jgi:hypothetical protein
MQPCGRGSIFRGKRLIMWKSSKDLRDQFEARDGNNRRRFDSVKADSIRASRDYGRHKTVELINVLKQILILRGLLQLYFMNQNQIAL